METSPSPSITPTPSPSGSITGTILPLLSFSLPGRATMKAAVLSASTMSGVSTGERGRDRGSGMKDGRRDRRNTVNISSPAEYQEQERLFMKSVVDAKNSQIESEESLPMVWRGYGRTVIEAHYFNSLKKCFEPLLEHLSFSVLMEKVINDVKKFNFFLSLHYINLFLCLFFFIFIHISYQFLPFSVMLYRLKKREFYFDIFISFLLKITIDLIFMVVSL